MRGRLTGRGPRRAFVLTVSARSARGEREDTSGPAIAERLAGLGYAVDAAVVPDHEEEIARAVRDAARDHVLVVTTGGTGMGPRDVTPQALRKIVDYEVPGFGEAMRGDGDAVRHPLALPGGGARADARAGSAGQPARRAGVARRSRRGARACRRVARDVAPPSTALMVGRLPGGSARPMA